MHNNEIFCLVLVGSATRYEWMLPPESSLPLNVKWLSVSAAVSFLLASSNYPLTIPNEVQVS